MGLAVSCTGEDALDQGFEALLMRSLSFDRDNVKSTLRSVSFNGRDTEPAILKAFGSGKLIIEGSLSFKEEVEHFGQLGSKISIKSPTKAEKESFMKLETKILIKSPTAEKESLMKPETKILIKSPMAEKESSIKGATLRTSRFNPLNERATVEPSEATVEPSCKKFKAAVKLQKVYKSFRTRRQLADCAVLVEQRWWKLLDFALLKQSSVSFFDIEEPESVVSRWSRARRRAAKVGKGLSKDEKAQKLALQHWLEAIDPRHRYGHNLQFYYDCWLHCASKQPFFYWLDVGEGKEVNLEDKCTRAKLQQQCIKYLGPKERENYEVIVEDGKLLYKGSGKLLDTSEGSVNSKWIFVLSTSKTLYVGQKKKGNFQHSSFLAGGATSAAGRLVVDNGVLKAVWPHSGHYRPTEQNFQEFVTFLKDNNVELTDVKLSPAESDDEMLGAKSFRYDLDLTETAISVESETRVPVVPENTSSFESSSRANNSERDTTDERSSELEQYKKIHEVTVPSNQDESDDEADTKVNPSEMPNELECSMPAGSELAEESSSEGHYMYCKQNLFLEEQEEDGEASVPQEVILRRINSKKGMESYQLGKQLSCKWTTGAGPRIGWVRDYPSELQLRSLEQVNLSPRSGRPQSSPRFQSFQSPRMVEAHLSNLSPRNERQQQPSPTVSSPRMTEVPLFRKVPLLQKPNMCRKF